MCESSEIHHLFQEWAEAVQAGDPDRLAQKYAPDAILIPTLSNRVCHNRSEIRDYFAHFLQHHPCCEMEEKNLCVCGNVVINSGIYCFKMCSPDGKLCTFRARYSFVYKKMQGRWLIIEHHSSKMPE